MLAGRKLLLADDSVTIQKVVELTFADEGVEVIAVGNGTEAIERLEEIAPDVVLADLFMPGKNGYEVCEYIKKNEKLHRIPVMLLVGSFEPFDEAEARRVGADDILTKPFQSIRRLIDRVGGLVTGKLNESQTATADLSHPAIVEDSQTLNTGELKIRNADTQPLNEAMPAGLVAQQANPEQPVTNAETNYRTAASHDVSDSGDVLLELDDLEPVRQARDDDFVLDIELDEPTDYETASRDADTIQPQPDPAETQWDAQASVDSFEAARTEEIVSSPAELEPAGISSAGFDPVKESPVAEPEPQVLEQSLGVPTSVPAGQITLEQLSPEAIDAIAKRAVEQLSEKVIQEIAWEVVPSLAELLIKRQLQQKESQTS